MREQFGKYELLAKLGTGGMAVTYRAQLKGAAGVVKPVVIKRVLPQIAEDQQFIDAFIQEAKVSAQLSHANIAHVFDFGEQDGEYFLAMEFIRGKNLDELIDRAASLGFWHLPVPVAVLITIEVLKGLQHAHTRVGADGHPLDLVHRDVSPDNVLVGYEGEIKLIDFGVAKARLAGRRETEPGLVKGKYLYFSPEQAIAEDKLDGRSDVFAAGVMLYRMLAGRYPFEGGMSTALHQLVRGRYPPLGEVNHDLPFAVVEAVEKAMKQNRDERFQSAAAFADQLQAFLVAKLPGFSTREVAAFTRYLFADEAKREGLSADPPPGFKQQLEAWKPPPRPDGKLGPVPERRSLADAAPDRPTMPSTQDSPAVQAPTPSELNQQALSQEMGRGWLKPVVAVMGLTAAGVFGYSVWQDTRPPTPLSEVAQTANPPKPGQQGKSPVADVAPIPGAATPILPPAPQGPRDDTPLNFGIGEVVIPISPTRHKVAVREANDVSTFSLTNGQSLSVTATGGRALYYLGDANFGPVGLGELRGHLTFKGPGKVRVFDLPVHDLRWHAMSQPTQIDGKPYQVNPKLIVQGVEGDLAEMKQLSTDATYHLEVRAKGKVQLVMSAVNVGGAAPAGSVPRILSNGVSFDLHGIDLLSFAFIEGFDHDGPAEVLIGQKSGPIESYAVKRACERQHELEAAKDTQAAKVAALTCALHTKLDAEQRAWDERNSADEACGPWLSEAAELSGAGKIKEALAHLAECAQKLEKSCRCALAYQQEAQRAGTLEWKSPTMARYQACVLQAAHQTPGSASNNPGAFDMGSYMKGYKPPKTH